MLLTFDLKCIAYFSGWKDFRVPTITAEVKVAMAENAFGVWYDNTNTFQIKLPAGVCAADVTFMGTTGIHEFHFTLDSAKASHVAWKHIDYEHTSVAFLLERAFSCNGKYPQVVELPLPRVAEFSRYHNPTRPSHLVGGVLVCSSYGLGTESCLFYKKNKFKKQSKICFSTKVH